jgi:aminoglycoside/choline kinase family phosphotransferase
MLESPATTAREPEASPRLQALTMWLRGLPSHFALQADSLRPAASDASLRRYFRVDASGAEVGASCIVMDCPPQGLSTEPFVRLAKGLQQAGLHAPRVWAEDPEQGFVLLSDLGDTQALACLQQAQSSGQTTEVHNLMRQAIALLVKWQQAVSPLGLPTYDEAWLQRELDLFPQWCVQAEFGVSWSPEQQAHWAQVCALLKQSALAQATVAVHRDFMARNFMVTPEGLALLDFQDAACGPISYDIASLIRDAFFSLPEDEEIDIAVRYWQAARQAELPVPEDFGTFWRQIEWMGLQRHLKVLGIFCRLKHRDGKPHYAQDLPRFFHYAHKVATRYHGLGPLAHLLEPLMGTQRVEAFY